MQQKNNFIGYILLMQCCFVFSYESPCSSNNSKNNVPQAEIHVSHDTHVPNNWRFSANVKTMPDYSDVKTSIHYPLLYQASPQLKYYFSHVVAPLMY